MADGVSNDNPKTFKLCFKKIPGQQFLQYTIKAHACAIVGQEQRWENDPFCVKTGILDVNLFQCTPNISSFDKEYIQSNAIKNVRIFSNIIEVTILPVDSKSMTLSLYDATGRTIASTIFDTKAQQEEVIILTRNNQLHEGAFFVSLFDEKSSSIKKILTTK